MRSLALLLVISHIAFNVEGGPGLRSFTKRQSPEEGSGDEFVPVAMTTPAGPTFSEFFGYDLVEKITNGFGALEQYLLTMNMNSNTRGLVQEMVDANPCVNSLAAYTSMMNQGSNLLVENAPLLERVVESMLKLRNDRNMTSVLLTSAALLHDLDDVMPLFSYFMCQPDPQLAVDSLRETAFILIRISKLEDVPFLQLTTPIREGLRSSARLTEAVSNWVDHFFRNIELHDCYTTKDGLGDFIEQTVFNIKDMGEILGALQHFEAAKEVRDYAKFVASLKDTLKNLPKYNLPGFCGLDTFGKVGDIVADMSTLVAEVGLESLATDLGVSFRLDLLPQ